MKSYDVTVATWGNSLAVRLPKKEITQLGISANDQLTFEIVNGEIILKPKTNPFEKLFEGFNVDEYWAQRDAQELDWGGNIGKEMEWEEE